MKKIISVILLFVVSFSFLGCSNKTTLEKFKTNKNKTEIEKKADKAWKELDNEGTNNEE